MGKGNERDAGQMRDARRECDAMRWSDDEYVYLPEWVLGAILLLVCVAGLLALALVQTERWGY